MARVLLRKWLESQGTSFIILRKTESYNSKLYPDEYELLMHDCNRQIHWLFEKGPKGRAKLEKIKAVLERLEKELNV